MEGSQTGDAGTGIHTGCSTDGQVAAPPTFWVADCLSWRGVDLTYCTAECRLHLLASYLQDACCGAEAGESLGAPRIRLLPAAPADPAGLQSAYTAGRALACVQVGWGLGGLRAGG